MTKEQSAFIKGIAIILMLIYHLGCIEGISDMNNPILSTVSTAAHPISYFLIISGYGLYYAYKQSKLTWNYLLKRTMRLYLAFWLVLLIFVFGISSILYPGRFSLSWDVIAMNLIGWHWDYCNFTWFLLPYIFMSFSAKWVFHLIDRIGIPWSLLCGMAIRMFTSFLISRFFDSWLQFHYPVYHIVLWGNTLFCLIIGASFAKIKLAGSDITWKKLYGHNLLVLLILIFLFVVRSMIHSSVPNPFHAAIVIWLILHLNINRYIKFPFIELGNKSFLMWLTQGFIAVVMFSEYFIQLRWPLLILIVWAIICYIVASVLMPLSNLLFKIIFNNSH